jgi:hypothetical protein
MASACLTSVRVIGPALFLFCSAVAAQSAEPAPRLLGVRVIKAVPGLTNKTPTITFPGAEDACRPGGYRGENIKEFYFDAEVALALKTPPTARFACEGVEVACVRVGHAKVDFDKGPDGGATFPLVFDEKSPYTLHMENRDVPEVLLYGMHKPRDRASGPAFRDVPWEPAAVAAEWNLLYGCLEVFRDMNIGDPATKDFDGYVAIGGYETTYPRTGRGPQGHVEGTAHIHLFLVVPPGWRIRLIRYDPDTSAVLSRTQS